MKINQNNPAEVFASSLNSQNSTKTTLRVINYLCNEFNQTDYKSFEWSTLDYAKLLNFRRQLVGKNLKTATINSYISTLKSVCRESWRLDVITTEAYMRIKDIRRIKGNSKTAGRALEVIELQTAINYTRNDNKCIKSIRDSAIIAIGYGAGLRPFELAKITMNELNKNQLIVYGKGRNIRTVYLPLFAMKKLNKWLSIRGKHEGALFSALARGGTLLNRQISTRTVGDIIQARCIDAGLCRFTPHDLRRSFATNLLNAGIDVFLVQKLMRHADINTTRIYDMRGDKAIKEAVELLPF